MMNKASIRDLQSTINESNIEAELKEKLKIKVSKLESPLDTDKMIYRIVVGSLGLAILACLTFSFFITLQNTDPNSKIEMPDIFLAIGSAAVGALAGLLAPSPRKNESE